MIKIEVASNEVNERSGIRVKDGTKWSMRTQEIFVDCGDKYPAKTTISLEEGQAPYAAGMYTLAPASVRIGGEYNKLEFSRNIVLTPLNSSSASNSTPKAV